MKRLITTLVAQLLCASLLLAQNFVSHQEIKHDKNNSSVTISPDGKWLVATKTKTDKLTVYDVASRKIIKKWTGLNPSFSANGKYLSIRKPGGSYTDPNADLYNVSTWKSIKYSVKSRSDKFSPDGKIWATYHSYYRRSGRYYVHYLDLWNPATGSRYSHISSDKSLRPYSITNQYVVARNGNKLKVWDAFSGKELQSFNRKDCRGCQIVVNPDGRHLAIQQSDKVELWNFMKAKKLRTFSGNYINGVKFSKNGRYLVVGANSQTHIWDVEASKTHQISAHERNYTRVVYSHYGKYKLVIKDKKAALYDVFRKKKIQSFEFNGLIYDVNFSANNQYLAIADKEGTIKIWVSSDRLKNMIQQRMKAWLKKGEFEKTTDYKARVASKSLLKKMTHQFSGEIINQQVSLDWKASQLQYDADNEAFKITVANYFHCYVKVPIKKAPQFKQDFKSYRFEPTFGFTTNNQLALAYLKLIHPNKEATYAYRNRQTVNFQPQIAHKVTIPTIKPTEVNPSVAEASAQIGEKLPKTRMRRPKAFAVVIGNAAYKKAPSVDFAVNDAQVMKKYLTQVMGFKEGNIFYVENASKTDFELLFGNQHTYKGKLYNSIVPNESEVFIYYTGHGAPDLNNKQAYFVPTDATPNYLALSGYAMSTFYKNLAKLPAKSLTIVLDACFSGATMNGSVFKNISPIEIKPKGLKQLKNAVLLTSSKGTQVSSWHNAQKHSLFTYFFLKAIHNKNADANKDKALTIKEIYQYIAHKTTGVPYFARKLHGIDQTPVLRGAQSNRVLVKY